MARVVRRAASAAARRAPTRAVQRRARKHKVIMESVTREKKKLRSVICFEAKAPSGYTFIPAGNPLLTTTCKEKCRIEGLEIFAVSTTPHLHTLSQHVHRIGYHFPSVVVAASCSELGLYLTSSGKAVPFHDLGTQENRPQAESEMDQATINTEARDAIKDLFPTIPDNDLFQIIKTAFQKGQRKVGTAVELPLARRAQLAVVAHIRHIYTDYDRLLKATSFHEARSTVEQPTLAKIIEWRGDDENGETVLEDVFREVIVISDDEDSEAEEDGPATTDPRDPNVEILSSTAGAHQIQTQPVTALGPPNQNSTRHVSEEAPPGIRFIAKTPGKKTIDRRGFSRYQAWNRALNRHRAEAHGTEQTRLDEVSSEKQSPRYAKRSAAAAYDISESAKPRSDAVPSKGMVPRVPSGPVLVGPSTQRQLPGPADRPTSKIHVGSQERHSLLESPRMFSQPGSSGRPLALTTQKPHEVRRLEQSPRQTGQGIYLQGANYPDMDLHRPERIPGSNERVNAPVFVSGPSETHPSNRNQFGSRSDFSMSHSSRPGMAPQEYVLPSIEAPWPTEKRRMDGRLAHLTKRMSLRSVTPVHSQAESFSHVSTAAPDSPDDPNCKRRRLVYADPRLESRPEPWGARPAGTPISEEVAPRGQYHRDENASERRPTESMFLRRDYAPLVEQPVMVGSRRERNLGPFMMPSANHDARPGSDRTRVVDPHEHVSMPTSSQPMVSSGKVPTGDRGFRSSSPGSCSPFHGGIAPPKQVFRANDRSLVQNAPSAGRQYADGFVRHVDIHETRPVEHYAPRPRPQVMRLGEVPSPPTRTRNPDLYGVQELSYPHVSSEQRLPHSALAAPTVRDHPGSHAPREPPSSGRDRRPGSGLGTTRRVHDPRAFQMAEQSRPIYVQRVESHPPPQSVPDNRPVVIVD
ncbi:hypothetical protein N7512_007941 [Penicillium capsulatum]|nr:hypothetical protein N7512_007941 [Penicillium capsulatum]